MDPVALFLPTQSLKGRVRYDVLEPEPKAEIQPRRPLLRSMSTQTLHLALPPGPVSVKMNGVGLVGCCKPEERLEEKSAVHLL